MQISVTTMENSVGIPQKIKSKTALWPSNSISGNISEEIQNTYLKNYVHPPVHCSIIYNSWDMEVAQGPINGQGDKKAVVHIHSFQWSTTQ